METDLQREARRTISGWLTKHINNAKAGAYPKVRAEVMKALETINKRLNDLNASLNDKYSVRKGKTLIKFYMKGGNAFSCIHDPTGLPVTSEGGGDSDWDTQVVVDPWVPVPVQNQLYGLIQEIVMEEMVQAGIAIANAAGPFTTGTEAAWGRERHNVSDRNLDNYTLTYDDPQTVRQVYDPDRLGLWMNDRRKLKDPTNSKPMQVPGIIFNDAIRPFAIYRLGYTWHAEKEQTRLGQATFDCDVEKPILMELIDVTLPRRNTIEAVAVWEEIEQRHITVTNVPITVAANPHVQALLPLPDMSYHLREISTMMCEIADGSSHHQDKLHKRFARFKVIWDGDKEVGHAKILKTLGGLAGVAADFAAEQSDHHPQVTAAIKTHGDKIKAKILDDSDDAYRHARQLMDIVATRSQESGKDFTPTGSVSRDTLIRFDTARAALHTLLAEAVKLPAELSASAATEVALSDDLALLKLVEENEYLDVTKIGFSGVDRAAVVRVPNHLALDAVANAVLAKLDPLKLDPKFSGKPLPKTKVHYREHNTVRRGGISYEKTMVVFNGGRAEAYLTLTTASQADAPFRADPGDTSLVYASLLEIASQRKVAAALSEDYVVRTAIARQYEALKTLLREV